MTTESSEATQSGTDAAPKGLFGKIFGEKKQIRKAKMGQEMQMYYNEELKCWVMPGEEDAKRKEVEALRAPPMMPSSAVSEASGSASVAGPQAGGPGPGPTRQAGLASRYAAMPTMSVSDGQTQTQGSVMAGLKPPPVGGFGVGAMGSMGSGQFQPMQPFKPVGGAGAGGAGAQSQAPAQGNVWQKQRMELKRQISSHDEGDGDVRGGTSADVDQMDPMTTGRMADDSNDATNANANSTQSTTASIDPFVLEVLSFWSYYREAGYEVDAMLEWVGENYGEDVAGELDCESLLMDERVMEAVVAYKATHMNDAGGIDAAAEGAASAVDADVGEGAYADASAGQAYEEQQYPQEPGAVGAAEPPPLDAYQGGYEMAGFGGMDAEGGGGYEAGVDAAGGVPQVDANQEYGYETPADVLSPADHAHQQQQHHHQQQQEQHMPYTDNALYAEATGADHTQLDTIRTPMATPTKSTGTPITSPSMLKMQMIAMQDHIYMESHLLKTIEEHTTIIEALKTKLDAVADEASSSKYQLEEKVEELRAVQDELDALVQSQAASAAEAAETEQAAKEAVEEAMSANEALEKRLEDLQAELTAARAVLESEQDERDQRAADLENDVLALRDQVSALEEEKAELAEQTALEEMTRARDELSDEVRGLREELAAIQAASAECLATGTGTGTGTGASGAHEELLQQLSAIEAEKAAMQDDFQTMLDERDAEIMQLEARVMLSESAVQSASQSAREEVRSEVRIELRDELTAELRPQLLEEAKLHALSEMADEKEQLLRRQLELEAQVEQLSAAVPAAAADQTDSVDSAERAALDSAQERVQELERKFALAKKKIHAQTSQIDKLTAEIAEKQQLVNAGGDVRDQEQPRVDEAALGALFAENASLKATIDALQLRIGEAEAVHEQEIGNLMKENDQLMDALSEKEDHMEMVTTELAQLRADAEASPSLEASAETAKLAEELDRLREAEAALQEERASREEFRQHVEAEQLRMYDQIAEYEGQVELLKEALGEAQSDATGAAEEADGLRQQVEGLRAEIEDLEDRLQQQIEQIEQLQLQAAAADPTEAITEATKELAALLEQRTSELVSLQESLDVERMERNTAEEDLRQRVAQLQEQFSFVEEAASTAQQALMEERGAKDLVSAQYAELSEKMQEMVVQLNQAQHEAQEAADDVACLRSELDRSRDAREAETAEMAELKATLADYESSLQEANETLENAQRDIAELTEMVEGGGDGNGGRGNGDERIEELEREISGLRHQLASMSEGAGTHQDELRKYKLQLVKAKKLRAADQEKIEELQNSIDDLNEAVALAMQSTTRGDQGDGAAVNELDAINQELESSLTDALTALGQEEAKVVRLVELLTVAGLTDDEIQAELDSVADEVGYGDGEGHGAVADQASDSDDLL